MNIGSSKLSSVTLSLCASSGTGNTVIEAVKVLIEHGVQPRHIILLSLFSTPHGSTTPPTARSQFTSVYPAALTSLPGHPTSCFTAADTSGSFDSALQAKSVLVKAAVISGLDAEFPRKDQYKTVLDCDSKKGSYCLIISITEDNFRLHSWANLSPLSRLLMSVCLFNNYTADVLEGSN